MITIIDYKTGNLSSIQNLIKKIGYSSVISSDPEVIAKASKLILPGVGHFDYGMKNLKELGLIDVLNDKVIRGEIPVLGICLGLQLFTAGSEEGIEKGLGWLRAKTIAFHRDRLASGMKVPHMGWSDATFNSECKLFTGFTEVPRFYFVHSFHIACEASADESSWCNYGYSFTAGAEYKNVTGVQFHPEKSHRFGLQVMTNFLKYY